jgi:hypothetical protein
MSEYKLIEEIIALSYSKNWDSAKLEWTLESIYFGEGQDSCLCGHFPIVELCQLKNKVNRNTVIVGNYCVNKFLGLPSAQIFQAVKRVQEDITKSFNAESIHHARTKRWIDDWDFNFYSDVFRKRNLSEKQLNKKIAINEKILKFIVNGKN